LGSSFEDRSETEEVVLPATWIAGIGVVEFLSLEETCSL
jgi:hypothetical protein